MYLVKILLTAVILYLIFSLILGIIPVNRAFRESQGGRQLFIVSNGIHTDIVLPAGDPEVGWPEFFRGTGFSSRIGEAYYISFGWGDKIFYLNTPEWKDLTLSIAMDALFFKPEPAMHVTLLSEIYMDNLVRPVRVSESQFRSIEKYVHSSFRLDVSGHPIQVHSNGYSNNDLFFEAEGKFSVFNPCNAWTLNGLKHAGIRCPVWTPFDRPILWQLSHIRK